MGTALILTNQGIKVQGSSTGSLVYTFTNQTQNLFTVPADQYAVLSLRIYNGLYRSPYVADFSTISPTDQRVIVSVDGKPVFNYSATWDTSSLIWRVGSSKNILFLNGVTPFGRSFQEAVGTRGIVVGPGHTVSAQQTVGFGAAVDFHAVLFANQ